MMLPEYPRWAFVSEASRSSPESQLALPDHHRENLRSKISARGAMHESTSPLGVE
jgi:hypothetical protein